MPGSGARVLVVEDADEQREMLLALLELAGFDAHGAADGVSGLRLARALRPGAILLDLGLPELSGWDLARMLKHDPETREIRILVCSAYTADADRERAMEAGCDRFIAKPVAWEALRDDLTTALAPIRAAPRP